MGHIELFAIGWGLLALFIFGFQAKKIHLHDEEEHWHIKSPHDEKPDHTPPTSEQ
ncbi:hypothetical protein [Reichenbachiella sp. 5M10]|uniref:hypothetical protein n=1 Tax=Reichenbachiella sp. 5M10 TaxID=1889772 RepID=UPI00130464F1|nr:hypothetical protein [Reichenbachiella sp. 5M10]